MTAPTQCHVEGCDRPIVVHAAGLCRAHYQRQRRTGSTGPGEIGPRLSRPATCQAPGCAQAHYCHGYCRRHDYLVTTYGPPAAQPDWQRPPRPPAPSGVDHVGFRGDAVTYQGAHGRLLRRRGQPRHLACARCGRQAAHWVLRPDVPQLLHDLEHGWPYSPDPDDYDAMCLACRRVTEQPNPHQETLPGIGAGS